MSSTEFSMIIVVPNMLREMISADEAIQSTSLFDTYYLAPSLYQWTRDADSPLARITADRPMKG